MRIPISWLGEHTELPEDVSFEHLHQALVRVGFEEEAVHGSGISGPVVVGRVLERTAEPQSNGKTINWCQVDVGEKQPRGIVCGAHNFEAGDLVVVCLPGAVLPGPFPITARKTYGHVSDGMIASERELGLGDDHGGILRLADRGIEAEPGADALALLDLSDGAVEVNVTPDRGYALSIRGIAREYSLSTGAHFKDPALEPGLLSRAATVPNGFSLQIDDERPIRGKAGCDVFSARVVRGVDATRPTPQWMKSRLRLAGARSISLPVDISNYVMFELGQPIHTYDLNALQGGIVVRRARPSERLKTLDGQDRELDAEDLLITDDSGAIGIAGVMGGLSTEVTDATTDILIEAAHFDSVSVARSARRHRLFSEASKRFERGVDPQLCAVASQRVADLLIELAGAVADPLGADVGTAPESVPISLHESAVESLIGVHFSADEITETLIAIGCEVSATDVGWSVTPPSWRPDLVGPAHLAEEVARVVGYDRIPAALPIAPPGRGLSRPQRLRRLVANVLAASGLTEVLAYPFLSEDEAHLFEDRNGEADDPIRLANALDAAAAVMRTSLIPGLLQIAKRNYARGMLDVALFELGLVFLRCKGQQLGTETVPGIESRPSEQVLAELDASLPDEPWRVAAVFVGDAVPRQPGIEALPSGLAEGLSAVRRIAATIGTEVEIKSGNHPALHPGRTASLILAGKRIGWVGELLPTIAEKMDLPRRVCVLELDLDALIDSSSDTTTVASISGFPAATQDASLIVPIEVAAGGVLQAIREGAGDLLEDIRLVDDYRGTGIPEGMKSLLFALRFRAPDRTLTQAEATDSKLAGIALAAQRTGAVLRD